MNKITWGLVGNSHDASLSVFKNKELIWAALAKDFSGVPNDPHLNKKLMSSALEFGMPDQFVWYERPFMKTVRQFYAGQGWLLKENDIHEYVKKWGITRPIKYTQHHHSHAAYAYYTQPHDDCAVICLDSIGEFETLTIWHGKNGKLNKIYSQGYPHSPGLFYSSMTQRVGGVAQRDEYMLASMGENSDPEKLRKAFMTELIHKLPQESDPSWKFKENLHRGCNWFLPEATENDDLANIAATTQKLFEEAVQGLSAWAQWKTKSSNLALAGGGALNRQAVEKINPHWDNIHVPQNPGDPGSCVGAVLARTKTKVSLDNVWYQKV